MDHQQADRQLMYQIRKNLSVGQRRLEYELCKTLSVSWEYQSHKPWLSIMCHYVINPHDLSY